MKVCPCCGRILSFNSYFGAFICDRCHWEDDSVVRVRRCGIKRYTIISGKLEIPKVASLKQSVSSSKNYISPKCKKRATPLY